MDTAQRNDWLAYSVSKTFGLYLMALPTLVRLPNRRHCRLRSSDAIYRDRAESGRMLHRLAPRRNDLVGWGHWIGFPEADPQKTLSTIVGELVAVIA